MSVDRLATLLEHFTVSARMFHSGPLCGINDFLPQQGLGQLHLVQRGPLRIEHLQRDPIEVTSPTLLFYPRPMHHRFVSDAREGATMACAHLQFGDGGDNPLAASLPALTVMPLEELEGVQPLLEALFREAFGQHCGRQFVVDRLFDVVLVHILRRLMQQGTVDTGLLAGMAHPQLARSLVALHAQPAQPWSVQTLAREAGMSRTVYADNFRRVIGTTPAEYLATWRLSLTRQQLRQGKSLKQIADAVGYGSVATLSRAFRLKWGVSPREWKQAGTGLVGSDDASIEAT